MKNLVLKITNGLDKLNPSVQLVDQESAVSMFREYVGELLLGHQMKLVSIDIEEGTQKALFRNFDQDGDALDDFAAYLIEAEEGDTFIINSDIVDKVEKYRGVLRKDVIKGECPDGCVEEHIDNSWECRITSLKCNKSGATLFCIEVK